MPNDNLKKWRPGSEITAKRLDSLRGSILKDIRGTSGLNGLGTQVTYTGSHITIGNNDNRFLATPIFQRFRVVAFNDDYLECHTWIPNLDDNDGEEGTERVFIAKPYLLRQTPFDGESIVYPSKTISYTYANQGERTATSGGDEEDQVLIPEYFVDDEIIAIRHIIGSTGVIADTETPPATTGMEWEDMNTAGRFWARKDE